MPDRIDHLLEAFDPHEVRVDPLPAAEVRRRGTRLRRRQRVWGGVATGVVVVLVGAPLAWAANRAQDEPGPAAQPPSTRWTQDVPADFPITDGMPATNGNDGSPVLPLATSGVEDLTICGEPVWVPTAVTPAAARDLVGARYLGESEDSLGRVLALYADAKAAGAVYQAIRSAVGDCPVDRTGAPRADQAYAPVEAPRVGEQSLAFMQYSLDSTGQPLGDLWLYQVVRVGNALYLSTHYGQGGTDPEIVRQTTTWLWQQSDSVVAALCQFAADPCAPAAK